MYFSCFLILKLHWRFSVTSLMSLKCYNVIVLSNCSAVMAGMAFKGLPMSKVRRSRNWTFWLMTAS